MTDKIDMIWDSVKDLKTDLKQLDTKLDCVCEDVAGLKVKSGFWGAIAGLVPVSFGALWLYIKGGH